MKINEEFSAEIIDARNQFEDELVDDMRNAFNIESTLVYWKYIWSKVRATDRFKRIRVTSS